MANKVRANKGVDKGDLITEVTFRFFTDRTPEVITDENWMKLNVPRVNKLPFLLQKHLHLQKIENRRKAKANENKELENV